MKQREINWREKSHVEKNKDEKAAYEDTVAGLLSHGEPLRA
jgi:hypothetical protein